MSDTSGVLSQDWQRDIRYPVVYRVSTGGRIAFVLGALLFGGAGAFFVYLLLQRNSDDPSGAALMSALAMGCLAMAFYFVSYMLNATLTLERDAIEVRKPFSSRRLQRTEILGRRLTQGRSTSYPVIVPRSGQPLTIDRSTFALDDRFNAWFNALPDLQAQERAAALAEVENDASLGSSKQERLAKLDQAKKLAGVLNVAPMVLLFWAMWHPQPYGALVACAAALPWLAVVLCWAKPGLFQLDGKKGDVRPNLAVLFVTPPLVLALRALFDVDVIDLRQLFLGGFVLGLPLFAAILLAPRAPSTNGNKRWVLPLVMLPFMTAYGAGLLALTDAMWDEATPQVFQTVVSGKDVSHGKTTTYYLDLAPWNPTIDENRVAVSRALFNTVDKGDAVCVRLHPGKFGLRWMQVGGCAQ